MMFVRLLCRHIRLRSRIIYGLHCIQYDPESESSKDTCESSPKAIAIGDVLPQCPAIYSRIQPGRQQERST